MLHVRPQNVTRLASSSTLSPLLYFFHSNSHSRSPSNAPIPRNRAYRTLAQKTRYYGPAPSDVLPQVINSSQVERGIKEGFSAVTKTAKQGEDATRPKLIKGTPAHIKWCSETLTARLLQQNQQAFRELVTTGQKRVLEPYQYNDTIRFRLSFLAHKIYFPTITYNPPPQSQSRTKKSGSKSSMKQKLNEAPSYNVFVLISFNPEDVHPFSCRTLPAMRKLKRLKDSDPEFDPRLNRIGIKIYFEKPVFENHLEGMWVPVGDPLLVKIMGIYDSFGKKDPENGEEIREVCRRSFEKYVVRGESVPVLW